MENKVKVEGQPCNVCNEPYIIGKKGAYCKPCYIKWANVAKPQGGQQTTYQKTNDGKPVDWDKIAKGKVRHGVVVAMITAGKDYSEIKEDLNKYVDLIMTEPAF